LQTASLQQQCERDLRSAVTIINKITAWQTPLTTLQYWSISAPLSMQIIVDSNSDVAGQRL